MRSRNVIAHRGFWRTPAEKNTPDAFARALAGGFGIETDFRDLDGSLVVSHDPARTGAFTAESFFALCAASASEGLLALNVKADGLQTMLSEAVAAAGIDAGRTFVFDMSVPDARGYRSGPLPVYDRVSEFEPDPPLVPPTAGVWVDSFDDRVDQVREAGSYLERGYAVTIVSPELHGRGHEDVWARIRHAGLAAHDAFSLCTDLPTDALAYFGGAS
jgi:hypothetical protein